MKKRNLFLVICLLIIGGSGLFHSTNADAAVIGDDYPAKWKNLPLGATIDDWKMSTRYCTSFVANRLSKVNKFDIQRGGLDWDANKWAANAKSQGYRVDNTPEIGAVAAWSSKFHVAWVADIKGDQILIEEYNYDYKGNYNVRWISKNAPDNYIHFKDIKVQVPTPTLPNKNVAQPISLGINYETHVSKVGWMNNVSDGALSGSTGFGVPIEAIKIIFGNRDIDGSVEYRVHVSKIGWMPWVKSGEIAGTTGQSKGVEALEVRLTGEASKYYDIEYQAHVEKMGWQATVTNGQTAGTTGQSKHVQAIKFNLKRKPILQGQSEPNASGLYYRSHLDKEGWLGFVQNNEISGTTGLGISMQSLEVYVDGKKENVQLDAHVEKKGWINNSGGTVGEKLSLEAIKITLKNNLENKYDIYYQTHVTKKGWTTWVKNGEISGTVGEKKPIQAIRIKLIEKK
ncbi:CHAP domain-containing protein [Enterococcus ureasiticus]|uniref:Peptidase C51 domain-containing protein n=1 Tax=Enterococcus ureasiticus TaxID=903984 RepID=A0A1E5GIA2_9ENTE|nr:CHAP domain-containing protein [Enterococcus ureasiticus]OEG11980.1 hypothetical protein BCR21_07015 [Enterococcus ureasiticus]